MKTHKKQIKKKTVNQNCLDQREVKEAHENDDTAGHGSTMTCVR